MIVAKQQSPYEEECSSCTDPIEPWVDSFLLISRAKAAVSTLCESCAKNLRTSTFHVIPADAESPLSVE